MDTTKEIVIQLRRFPGDKASALIVADNGRHKINLEACKRNLLERRIMKWFNHVLREQIATCIDGGQMSMDIEEKGE
jgi:hypothetical protein